MKKILIVEDDPFIRDITTTKLASHPYEVIVAENGATALESLKTTVPDAVLLDLDLPDIQGVEILAVMRADARLIHVPVIIFSNNDSEENRRKVTQFAISGFFIKASTEYSELFALIDSL